ncbi:MAG: hypothetical protein LIR50_07115 [Bacillota bacterium]|nr:hypothetical protein [Bacillota bacterium]
MDLDKLILKLVHSNYYGDEISLSKEEIAILLEYCYYLKSLNSETKLIRDKKDASGGNRWLKDT